MRCTTSAGADGNFAFSQVSTFASKLQFLIREKCQLHLIEKGFPSAIQAFEAALWLSYCARMHDEAAELRLKAEACRRLADLAAAADPVRKALWLTRADQWNELADKAAKRSRRRKNADC